MTFRSIIEKLDHLPLPAAKCCKQVAGDMSALYAHVLGQGDVENGPVYGSDSPFCRTTELPQWCVYSRSSVRLWVFVRRDTSRAVRRR